MKSTPWNSSVIPMLIGAFCLTSCATPQPPPTWDGLDYRATKGIDAVYVRPNVDLSTYRTILIDPVQVVFASDWNPNAGERSISRRLSVDDIQAIRTEMADTFRQMFTEELVGAGYPIVERPDADALRVSAALTDVYIVAPERASTGPSQTYSIEPSRMMLALELRDSVSGETLGRVVDKKTTTDTGTLRLRTSATNRAAFVAAVQGWAKRLRTALDTVHGKPSP